MLLGNFFTILDSQQTPGACLLQIQIADSHPIFDGHFPQGPVVPGVCQLQMLEEALSLLLNKSIKLSKAGMVKFLVGIEPVKHRDLTMDIKFEESDNEYTVTASYYNATETFFKFKGELYAS
jgi:3-hydroxyacyl-[acyl-carrier-protein] dehydratase